MNQLPTDLRYTRTHEWVRLNDDGTVTVGITDQAQERLGDLVFVEAPQPDTMVTAGEACALVESVKAASDIYAPVSGTVVTSNQKSKGRPLQSHSRVPRQVFAGTDGGTLYHSTDRGASWQVLPVTLDSVAVGGLLVMPKSPNP